MDENISSLILEHLRGMRAKIDTMAEDMVEVKHRLASLETSHATLLQRVGHLASQIAQQQVSFDRLSERVRRIETRLELA